MLEMLRAASVRLDAAEKSGKQAEKLLKQAKSQGEKEASVYLKYYQYAKAATAPTTPAPSKSSSK